MPGGLLSHKLCFSLVVEACAAALVLAGGAPPRGMPPQQMMAPQMMYGVMPPQYGMMPPQQGIRPGMHPGAYMGPPRVGFPPQGFPQGGYVCTLPPRRAGLRG